MFDSELRRLMKKRGMTNYNELSNILGVDNKTLYNWRMNPSCIPFTTFVGIYHILYGDGIRLTEIIEIAENYGINIKKDE